MTVSFSGRVAAVVGGVLVQSVALASMGNIGTTYGVLPSDIASAQALSLVYLAAAQVSTVIHDANYDSELPVRRYAA